MQLNFNKDDLESLVEEVVKLTIERIGSDANASLRFESLWERT